MSNGIGKNPLNDISKVYLQQIAEKKRDNSYLEPDMKKRQANNEKAIKDMKKMGTSMKNPHFEENQMEGVRDTDPEKGTAERKARLEKKRGMKLDDHPQYKKEEVEQVDENRAAMGRINKEYHRKKEAEAMAARKRDPKVKRDLPKRKNDNPMYDPKSAGSSRVKGFKFTPVKESWADAYKAVYEVDEAAKPDYLDFDKDGNKKESMKKALKDKKKGNPKHGMKGHKCDDDCDHDENGNGGDMSEAKDFIQKAIKRPGAFTAKAKERGMSAKEFASKVTANSKDYDERTVKQANLAKTLSGLKKEEQDFDAILQEVQKDGTPIEEALWIIANTTI